LLKWTENEWRYELVRTLPGLAVYRCECESMCEKMVKLTADEYADARELTDCRVVHPAHQARLPWATVLHETRRYSLVQNRA
jgi:hypothetical protein